MAFTTNAKVLDAINAAGSGAHQRPSTNAVTDAVAGANAELEKMGVPSTETDAALLSAATRLALSYLLEGLIMQMALRRESQATGSLRLAATQFRRAALETAGRYISVSIPRARVVRNRNWAHDRGGPLYHGSEAGKHERSGAGE